LPDNLLIIIILSFFNASLRSNHTFILQWTIMKSYPPFMGQRYCRKPSSQMTRFDTFCRFIVRLRPSSLSVTPWVVS
jgi:hypothetical protein